MNRRNLAKRAGTVLTGVVLPAVLTLAFLRFLLPVEGDRRLGTIMVGVAGLAREHAIPLGAGLFLVFAVLGRCIQRELLGRVQREAAPPAGDEGGESSARPSAGVRGSVAFVATVVAAALAAVVLRASVFQPYRVLSASMLPVLEPGDELVVDKRAYGFRLPGSSRAMAPSLPSRGDIVVFGKEVTGRREELVKRVIGLPGDRVSVSAGRLLINGWEIPTCDAGRFFYLPVGGGRPVDGRLVVEFLDDRAYLTVLTPGGPPFEAYVVEPGELFVLGDNRNESSDSRVWNDGRGGGVPLAEVAGRSSRRLVGRTRAGRPDFGSLFERLGTNVALEGVDVRPLEANIERCLAKRPARTSPPRPH